MASASGTPRPRSVLVLVILTSISLMVLTSRGDGAMARRVRGVTRDAFAPIRSLGSRVAAPFGDFSGSVTKFQSLKRENVRLRTELAKYRGLALQSADARRERAALLKINELDNADDIAGVTARILGGSPSNLELTVELDRGTSSGIGRFMPVVTDSGLVGLITSVSRSRATVQLISDPRVSVGVRLADSGDVGVAQRVTGSSNLQVNEIETDTVVKKGEAAFTSGLQDSRYPPGILVGTVASTSSVRDGDLQQRVSIKPTNDFRRLGFVRVLLWVGG